MGGVHVSREAGNPRAPSCRGSGPVSEPSCPVPSRTGQGRRSSAAKEDLSMCPVPGEEGQTQITTIVPRADRAGRKVSGPRQSGDRQGREMLYKTGGGHCGKKGTTGGLHGQDRVPGAVPGRRAAGCAVQGAKEAVGAWRALSPSGH